LHLRQTAGCDVVSCSPDRSRHRRSARIVVAPRCLESRQPGYAVHALSRAAQEIGARYWTASFLLRLRSMQTLAWIVAIHKCDRYVLVQRPCGWELLLKRPGQPARQRRISEAAALAMFPPAGRTKSCRLDDGCEISSGPPRSPAASRYEERLSDARGKVDQCADTREPFWRSRHN
jgi:hypothetical protein